MIMMLPLLPQELLTPELVAFLKKTWEDSSPNNKRIFDKTFAVISKTYVGTHKKGAAGKQPTFHPSIWSVAGMKIRTNNSAESVHSRLNPKVSGHLSFLRFLMIVEEEMQRADSLIGGECLSQTNAVARIKKTLLGTQLEGLFVGSQGILSFLENCSLITQLKSKAMATRFLEKRQPLYFNDDTYTEQHRADIVHSARALFERICPGSLDVDDEHVLKATTWCFKPVQDAEPNDDDEMSELSLVEEGPRLSFIALNEKLAGRTPGDGPGPGSKAADLMSTVELVARPRPLVNDNFPGSLCAPKCLEWIRTRLSFP